jgi:hypothetical protein
MEKLQGIDQKILSAPLECPDSLRYRHPDSRDGASTILNNLGQGIDNLGLQIINDLNQNSVTDPNLKDKYYKEVKNKAGDEIEYQYTRSEDPTHPYTVLVRTQKKDGEMIVKSIKITEGDKNNHNLRYFITEIDLGQGAQREPRIDRIFRINGEDSNPDNDIYISEKGFGTADYTLTYTRRLPKEMREEFEYISFEAPKKPKYGAMGFGADAITARFIQRMIDDPKNPGMKMPKTADQHTAEARFSRKYNESARRYELLLEYPKEPSKHLASVFIGSTLKLSGKLIADLVLKPQPLQIELFGKQNDIKPFEMENVWFNMLTLDLVVNDQDTLPKNIFPPLNARYALYGKIQ